MKGKTANKFDAKVEISQDTKTATLPDGIERHRNSNTEEQRASIPTAYTKKEAT